MHLDPMIFEVDVLLGVEFAFCRVALEVAAAKRFVLAQGPFLRETTFATDAFELIRVVVMEHVL